MVKSAVTEEMLNAKLHFLCSEYPGGQRLWISLFLEILQVVDKIGIHQIHFWEDCFIFKNFKKLSLYLKHRALLVNSVYSLQPRTLLKLSQMISWRCFEIAALKTMERIHKNVCKGVSFTIAWILSTACYKVYCR